MRESLFRGKRFERERCGFADIDWVEGSLIDSGNHEQVAIFPWVNGASSMSVRDLVHLRMVGVDHTTVGQYTGLKDKNGRRIFEGDVVEYIGRKYHVEMAEERRGWWPFACGDGCGCCEDDTIAPCDCVVIGNVHDQPELLKEA